MNALNKIKNACVCQFCQEVLGLSPQLPFVSVCTCGWSLRTTTVSIKLRGWKTTPSAPEGRRGYRTRAYIFKWMQNEKGHYSAVTFVGTLVAHGKRTTGNCRFWWGPPSRDTRGLKTTEECEALPFHCLARGISYMSKGCSGTPSLSRDLFL